MKNRFLKIGISIILLLTLTMTNFVFVGSSIISYALNEIQTNHQNVEFDAYFKDKQNNKTTTLELMSEEEETKLYLKINVNKEGYFTGKIEIPFTNFTLEGTDSKYVQKIEGNTITLNQINAGGIAEIDLKIKPVKEEIMDASLLNVSTNINLDGIYKDSTEKDINIKASRQIKLELTENNNLETVENDIKIITNKIVKIAGEEKRVLQISVDLGVKDNNYPVKEIHSKISMPTIDGKYPEVKKVINRNSTTEFNYNYDGKEIETVFSNNPSDNNLILWKKDGKENAVYTYIYDKDVKLKGLEITSEETVILQNDKKIDGSTKKIVLDDEEKDNIIQISAKNAENSIYKGKLYSGIDKQITAITNLAVNLAKVEEYIDVKEEISNYISQETKVEANVYYNKTVLSKEKFDTIFGETGMINLYNEKGELLSTISNATKVDEKGNIVIDYTGKEPKSIEIKTTIPISEGNISFEHTKTIGKIDRNVIIDATELETDIIAKYNEYAENEVGKLVTYSKGKDFETSTKVELKETKTEATIEINKDTLSTIVDNEIEIKATLVTNKEEDNLYKDPSIRIELPEGIEKLDITSVDLVYETELKIKRYWVEENRIIIVELEGEQTSYKTQAVNGASVVINAKVVLNKTIASKEHKIRMIYVNYNSKPQEAQIETGIKIVAPKDITAINSISGLGIETIGQEDVKKVAIKRGASKQELEAKAEIINNNVEEIKDVKVLGTLLTNSKNNTLGVKITRGILIENAKVYYTENENATEDIKNTSNGWTESITEKSVKYLITIDKIDAQSSVVATYQFEIPENLEYNLSAQTGYIVTYKNTLTNATFTTKSTTILLETGIGPKAEVELSAMHGGENITNEQVVRNGEIIAFNIKVSNTGSEDINNITVSSKIPEGTIQVVPQDNYEYTGSSYYKEINTDKFEQNIGTLKVGEVATVTFEVRVNSNVEAGKEILTNANIKYNDVNKTSNTIKAKTGEGKISVVVKRVTDRNIDLYEAGAVQYYAIIENISNSKQENVKVRSHLSESLKVQRLSLITGMKGIEVNDNQIYRPGKATGIDNLESSNNNLGDVQTEYIDYKDEIEIGTLEPGEIKVLSYDMLIDKAQESQIRFSVDVINGQEEYKSNNWKDQVEAYKASMNIVDNRTSKYIKSGDVVEYTITINNESTTDMYGLIVKDNIPTQMTVKKASVNGQEVKNLTGNNLEIIIDILRGQQATIKIETIVNHSEGRDKAETIVNEAEAIMLGKSIATTSEISHIIEANQADGSVTEDPNKENNNNVSDNNIAEGIKVINGMAWYDENKDGKKDDNEKAFSGIKVRLLNAETKSMLRDKNGKILETVTDENGMYILNNIGNGKYIVIFDYDTSKYSVTKYMAEGVPESKNSNAIVNELTIGQNKERVTSTDIIEVNGQNISDVNIGLVELKVFDLKLEKFVSKILIQNSSGTTVKEYTDSTLAKYELDGKLVNGTNIIVEYKIKVTNVGELEGYVKKIADYVPSDLKFSSELNRDWYQTGENLYSASLSNDKILPGESKVLTLTLTKSMTENNVGRFNNRAEIVESYNELGIEDANKTDNDLGAADTIISIKTGGTIWITTFVIIAIVGLGITAFVIIKQKNKKENI